MFSRVKIPSTDPLPLSFLLSLSCRWACYPFWEINRTVQGLPQQNLRSLFSSFLKLQWQNGELLLSNRRQFLFMGLCGLIFFVVVVDLGVLKLGNPWPRPHSSFFGSYTCSCSPRSHANTQLGLCNLHYVWQLTPRENTEATCAVWHTCWAWEKVCVCVCVLDCLTALVVSMMSFLARVGPRRAVLRPRHVLMSCGRSSSCVWVCVRTFYYRRTSAVALCPPLSALYGAHCLCNVVAYSP